MHALHYKEQHQVWKWTMYMQLFMYANAYQRYNYEVNIFVQLCGKKWEHL